MMSERWNHTCVNNISANHEYEGNRNNYNSSSAPASCLRALSLAHPLELLSP